MSFYPQLQQPALPMMPWQWQNSYTNFQLPQNQQSPQMNYLAMPHLHMTSQPPPCQQSVFQPSQYTHQISPGNLPINNNIYSIVCCIAGADNNANSKVFEATGPDRKTYAIKCVILSKFPKVIDSHFIKELEWLEMLANEPSVVNLIEWQRTNLYLWIVLEKADCDFAKFIAGKILSEFDIKTYFRQMLHAVKKIHEKNIIHKDLKPKNFLVFGNSIKLADFGVSKGIKDNNTSCTGIQNIGTPPYMPPEAISDATGTYRASKDFDIWSLGCILYEMIFKRSYSHPTISYHNLALVLGQNLLHIDRAYETVNDPAMLIDFLSRCLQVERANRWTAEQLLDHPYMN